MRTLRIGLLGLFGLFGIPAAAGAQDKPTVAVLHFNAFAIGQDASALGSSMLDMVTTELAGKNTVRILDRAQVEDLLTKQKLIVSGRVADDDAVRAGKLLGAQYIVMGGVVMDKREARLDIRLVDVESSLTVRTFKERGDPAGLLELVQKLADNFTQDLKLPARAALAEVELPAAAILSYSRGLDFEKRGKRPQAVEMYEKTLQLSPGYDEAQRALARVK